MRTLLISLVACTMIFSVPGTVAWADGEQAGEFDCYVLALSWTPTWCATMGDPRGAPECEDTADVGWTLLGLWPQFYRGRPIFSLLFSARHLAA